MLVIGVESETTSELTIKGLSMEGSSLASKGIEEEGMVFVPASSIESKSTPMINEREWNQWNLREWGVTINKNKRKEREVMRGCKAVEKTRMVTRRWRNRRKNGHKEDKKKKRSITSLWVSMVGDEEGWDGGVQVRGGSGNADSSLVGMARRPIDGETTTDKNNSGWSRGKIRWLDRLKIAENGGNRLHIRIKKVGEGGLGKRKFWWR